jgi:hypothetical protein
MTCGFFGFGEVWVVGDAENVVLGCLGSFLYKSSHFMLFCVKCCDLILALDFLLL